MIFLLLLISLISCALSKPLPNDAPCIKPDCLRITTIESPPFIVLETKYDDVGNQLKDQEFGGFLLDVLDDLQGRINFTYKLELVPDNHYGVESNGEWQGLVGELVNDRADMALGPFTITAARSTAIKFSTPYMTAGIAPITRKPDPGDMLPFRDVADIVRNPRLAYGVIGQGSTHQFFRDNRYSLYKTIGDYIDAHERDVAATSMTEAIARIREGGFVFLGEEPMLRWYTNQEPCDLMVMGNAINVAFYGLGFQAEDHALEKKFTTAILAAQADGSLQLLEKTWWENDCPSPKLCMCTNTEMFDPMDSSESSSMETSNEDPTQMDSEMPTGDDNSGENELSEPDNTIEETQTESAVPAEIPQPIMERK